MPVYFIGDFKLFLSSKIKKKMNDLTLIGNIGADAEIHKFDEGRFAIRFPLAITENWRDAQGQKQSKTEWFRCVRYTKSDAIANYIKKGMKLCVKGKASAEAYINKENQAVGTAVCLVSEIHFIETIKPNNEG